MCIYIYIYTYIYIYIYTCIMAMMIIRHIIITEVYAIARGFLTAFILSHFAGMGATDPKVPGIRPFLRDPKMGS